MVSWIVGDRVALVTGYFGNHQHLVSDLAKQAKAIYTRPLFQGVLDNIRSRGPVAHPSYFLLFGYHRRISIKDPFPAIPDHWQMGEDILEEMIEIGDIPKWPMNARGSAFVPNLGNIKMKNLDWKRWIPSMFQTCIWLGTATPSYKSQKASIERNDERKGKGKQKASIENDERKGFGKQKDTDKGKGKQQGKGKGKQKDKVKGPGKQKGKGKGKQKDEGKGKDKYKDHKSRNWFDLYIS